MDSIRDAMLKAHGDKEPVDVIVRYMKPVQEPQPQPETKTEIPPSTIVRPNGVKIKKAVKNEPKIQR